MARKKQKKAQNNPLALVFILVGLILFLLGTYNFTSSIFPLKSNLQTVDANAPVAISIPSLGINAPVVEGGIENGDWILSDDAALYLPTSGKIGEGFNTVIYAHRRPMLFGKLKDAKIGDIITVKETKGREYFYVITSMENIDPTETEKLISKERNVLTLFTCDGWNDKERLLVKARLTPPNPTVAL